MYNIVHVHNLYVVVWNGLFIKKADTATYNMSALSKLQTSVSQAPVLYMYMYMQSFPSSSGHVARLTFMSRSRSSAPYLTLESASLANYAGDKTRTTVFTTGYIYENYNILCIIKHSKEIFHANWGIYNWLWVINKNIAGAGLALHSPSKELLKKTRIAPLATFEML